MQGTTSLLINVAFSVKCRYNTSDCLCDADRGRWSPHEAQCCTASESSHFFDVVFILQPKHLSATLRAHWRALCMLGWSLERSGIKGCLQCSSFAPRLTTATTLTRPYS